MGIFYNTADGTADDDFMFAGGIPADPHDTLNGLGGNDLLVGDYGGMVFTAGTDAATAVDLSATATWTTTENPDVGNPGIPHTSAYFEPSSGGTAWYKIEAIAGATITLDIDYGAHQIGASLSSDTSVRIYAADGTQVLFENDNTLLSPSDFGSTSNLDPMLEAILDDGGLYYIQVSGPGGSSLITTADYILNVSLTGQAVNNSGFADGTDGLNGGAGMDTLYGVGGMDTLDGGADKDSLYGGAGDDTLKVVLGEDVAGEIYDGGTGTDTLAPSAITFGMIDFRDDTVTSIERFFFSAAAVQPTLIRFSSGQFGGDGISNNLQISGGNTTSRIQVDMGTETSFSMANWFLLGSDFVCVINGDGDNETLTGSSRHDEIAGAGGNDTLTGGAGNDLLQGGEDSDTYVLGAEAAGDTINDSGASGTDLVTTLISRSLGSYTGIENLTLLGTGSFNLTGSSGVNVLTGNSGKNILNGGAGTDSLRGLTGNDTYILANSLDKIVDTGGTADFATSTINRNMLINGLATVERLTLLTGNTSAVGNNLHNIITGSAGKNTLNGGNGNDTLNGMNGNDVLVGGVGNDILIGGIGKDSLTGGLHNDIFRFMLKTHSAATAALADTIMDFDDPGKGNDRMDLSGVFGPKLAYIGVAAFSKIGQVRVNDIAGPDIIIEVNTAGNLAVDMAIRLKATGIAQIGLDDFVL